MTKEHPFYPTRLEEERGKENREVFSVSINPEERIWLDELKEDLNVKQDGKALKMAAFIGRNVLHTTFTRKFLGYLFKKERSKFDD